jgi:hypothetical protein
MIFRFFRNMAIKRHNVDIFDNCFVLHFDHFYNIFINLNELKFQKLELALVVICKIVIIP